MANLVNGLGGADGFGENQLTRNDDSYTSNISLTTVFGPNGLNFFGTNYTAISVNNNGNITFGSGGQSTYTPYGMQSSSRPMIAPFFADVDTRGGTVSPTSGGTSQGTNLVHYDFNSTGNGTLTVTWDDVGYYSSKTDKLNAFQLQLVGTGNGNFDVIFRYESINWTTGSASGGTDGLGGTVARAGYSTGDGTSWYELPQSGDQSAILDLEQTLGNTGVAGYYRFGITSGTTGNDNMRGTSANDSLYGSSGDDVIYGLAGNDVLYGAAGTDTLYGGLGDDTFVIDAQDTVIELAGQGQDTVQANFSYTLEANIERLILTGTNSINGTGNAINNTIIGNSGNNILNGGGGFDFASYELSSSAISADLSNTASQYTGQGYDTFISIEGLIGSDYGDTLTGNSAANTLIGGAGNDILNGGLGNDTLNGGSGVDQMTGGDGSDIYYVDNIDDVVTETNSVASSGGTDTVYSYLSAYTLGANVENGRILVDTAANLTGNSLNNVLYAGAGNNILNGGAGTDTASYAYAGSAVSANLNLTSAQATGGSGSDTLTSIENLTGSNYNDRLTGNSAANVLSGGNGNDILNGGSGADRMIGGDGSDIYYVDNIGDIVTETNSVASSGGTDTVYSYLSAYTLGANVENGRILVGTAANLTGNGLNNVFYAGAGNNIINGGAGTDTVSYAYAGSAITANLNLTTAQATGGSGADTLTAIENLIGSNYNDRLTGNSAANVLSGGNGNDILSGGSGNDTLSGGAGNDVLNGGSGADRMIGGDGSDIYYVDNIGDIVTETNAVASSGGTDTVYSYLSTYTLGANIENGRIVVGTAANLTGNSLNNALYAGAGNNILNGGAGTDTVSYAYAGSAVSANLNLTSAQATGGSGSDTLTAIENLIGSNYNDILVGNSAANVLSGGNGNDMLNGSSGNDTLSGGAGNDIHNGGSGADRMIGGDGSDIYYVDNIGDIVTETNSVASSGGIDTVYSYLSAYTLGANVENGRILVGTAANLTGNGLNNVLYAGAGDNILNGGAGTDTVSYAYAGSAVSANLNLTSAQATGGSGSDTLTAIENLIGSNYNDTLVGNSAANVLSGGNGNDTLNGSSGNDTLSGGAGNDRLIGGVGRDVLIGGSGNDIFDFDAFSEMGLTSTTWDVITDFTRGQDRIDLSTLDANTATVANDAFTSLIGSATAFTTAGQLKLVGTILYGNTDADASAEFAIQLTGINSLSTADFIL